MQKHADHITQKGRRFSIRTVALVAIVLLLSLLAAAGYFLVNAYREGQEIRRYVGGPFGQQLLYLQFCTDDEGDGGGRSESLEGQLSACQRTAGGKAGYYVYDFNIGRSVALSESELALWKRHSVLSFPESVHGAVEESATNPFNSIVPFAEFKGFDYDCEPGEGDGDPVCQVAPATCESDDDAIRCTVFNPSTEREESHVIERYAGLELLAPQGFIAGPDIYKMLKPSFFPSIDS